VVPSLYPGITGPDFLGAALMLVCALVFNNLAVSRRYPEIWF